jgi:DNA-binding transcriptional regulator YiaG
MYDVASDYFDKSYQDYNDEVAAKPDVFKAPPSLELAELSQHFKALSLIDMGNAKLAVIAFKEALKLTTEEALSKVHLSGDELHKIQQDRKLTQIDFEILLHQRQDIAKQEGKGKGQPGDKTGEKQSSDPSNAAGKGDRNQL